jgi:hypothetical protein
VVDTAVVGRPDGPPGMGNFLIKVGRRPGVPVHVDLTRAELSAGVHDTNKRWTTPRTSPAAAVGIPVPRAGL